MKRTLIYIVFVISVATNAYCYNYGTLIGNTDGCEKGEYKACNDLAGMYLTGENKYKLREDKAKAQIYYDKSLSLSKKYCDAGNGKACAFLAQAYDGMRWGIDQDYKIMMKHLTKSCQNKYAGACYALGGAYKRGKGVVIDKSKSLKYYEKSIEYSKEECNANIGKSCERLGFIYSLGVIVKEDKKLAKKYYTKSLNIFMKECDNKDSEGCYQVAFRYYYGSKMTEKNIKKALPLFKKSCEYGESSSCRYTK
ncbi:MAG: tetratricopeptide repeat protein [Campylobacterota bacterium]|nr:tetratricopeptide repeat protein [Campylobacterota bacterium]